MPRTLGDEQAGDLVLHPRRHDNLARVGQSLHPCRDVRHIAVDFASCVYNSRPGVNADADGQPFGAGILAIKLVERALDPERGARCALGVVVVRNWVAEQRHQRVTHFPGDVAAHLCHQRGGGIEISAEQVTPLLGIKARRNPGRNPLDRRTSP